MATYELRPIVADEAAAFAACLGAAFGGRMNDRNVERIAGELELDRTVSVFDGLEVIGTAASHDVAITVPGGHRRPVAAVTMVSVAPTHRRHGLLSAMMRRQLDDFRDRGEHVAALYASEGSIYGRFGYGVATYGLRCVIDKARPLVPVAAGGHDGSVRLVEVAHGAEAFPAVHAARLPMRPGEIDRPAGDWPEVLGEEGGPAERRQTFYVAYEEHGRIDGYAVYRVTPFDNARPGDRVVMVDEICALSHDAECALWRYLAGVDLVSEVRTRALPVDSVLPLLFADSRAVRDVTVVDRLWIRLVDVARALPDRRYGGEGALVLEVVDEFCPWNDGRWRLETTGDGEASVEPADGAEPDLTLPAASLASAWLGGMTLRRLVAAGRAVERVPGAAEAADRLFASGVAPYCTTNF